MNLNEQLLSVVHSAQLVISTRLKETGGTIIFYDKAAACIDGELEDDFLNAVPELNHYLDYEGITIVYPLNIIGDEHNAIVEAMDEQGEDYTIDLFELDPYNITKLADSLTL